MQESEAEPENKHKIQLPEALKNLPAGSQLLSIKMNGKVYGEPTSLTNKIQ